MELFEGSLAGISGKSPGVLTKENRYRMVLVVAGGGGANPDCNVFEKYRGTAPICITICLQKNGFLLLGSGVQNTHLHDTRLDWYHDAFVLVSRYSGRIVGIRGHHGDSQSIMTNKSPTWCDI